MGKEKAKKPLLKKWWFWLIVILILAGIGNIIEEPEAEQASSQPKTEDTKAEPKKVEEKKPKEEKSEEPKDPKSTVESILIKELGKETNMDNPRVVNIEDLSESPDALYFVATLNADENLTNKLTKTGILSDSKSALEKISKIKELKKIVLQWQLPLTDQYGNTEDGQVMIINIEREALDKINWDNFDINNFENVSTTYFEHPALKE
ncbi:hypothetical protein ACFRCQ_18095 [Cytobacillus firmus]|uniref:hypothetical protein n=1 Tax=Cytobacillus firmus TaxID=1399 RepID=UPI0036BD050D